jgi:hypothetical protein
MTPRPRKDSLPQCRRASKGMFRGVPLSVRPYRLTSSSRCFPKSETARPFRWPPGETTLSAQGDLCGPP